MFIKVHYFLMTLPSLICRVHMSGGQSALIKMLQLPLMDDLTPIS